MLWLKNGYNGAYLSMMTVLTHRELNYFKVWHNSSPMKSGAWRTQLIKFVGTFFHMFLFTPETIE